MTPAPRTPPENDPAAGEAPPQGITTEQAMAAGAVGRAGAEAAASAPPADREQATRDAVRETAESKGMTMTADQVNELSGQILKAMNDPDYRKALAGDIADEFANRGAFEPAPDRVAPSAPSPAEQLQAEDPAQAPAAPATSEAPRRKSLAERMLGS